ncbi:MAG: diacylglycerol kinase [Pseudonocardia sp.]|nr:diacylglycerol kinase [Pseudonocardia sp.]
MTIPAGTGEAPSRPSAKRRVAAAGALIALVAAVGLAVAGVLREPLRLVLVLVLVIAAVVAGWTALVHRGGRRAAAAAVAVVALAGIVVLLVTGSLLRLALVVGLVLLATAAARVALGHHLAPASGALTALLRVLAGQRPAR